jgi:hypothetical protein
MWVMVHGKARPMCLKRVVLTPFFSEQWREFDRCCVDLVVSARWQKRKTGTVECIVTKTDKIASSHLIGVRDS